MGLEGIQRGRAPAPPRILIYGTEGIGKSTLASKAPGPIFVQTEDGLGQIGVDRFPLATSFGDVTGALQSLAGEHGYQTVAIDSVDWLERLIWDEICRRTGAESIERAEGGYGKGYILALTQWRKVIGLLEALRSQGMAVILIAHAQVEPFADPEVGAYDRYGPRIHKKAAGLLVEWCDIVAFATRRLRIENETLSFNRERRVAKPIGSDGGDRILRCVGSPSCIAKNRYSLPAELPLSWDALMAGLAKE